MKILFLKIIVNFNASSVQEYFHSQRLYVRQNILTVRCKYNKLSNLSRHRFSPRKAHFGWSRQRNRPLMGGNYAATPAEYRPFKKGSAVYANPTARHVGVSIYTQHREIERRSDPKARTCLETGLRGVGTPGSRLCFILTPIQDRDAFKRATFPRITENCREAWRGRWP